MWQVVQVGGNTCNNTFQLPTPHCCTASCKKMLLVLFHLNRRSRKAKKFPQHKSARSNEWNTSGIEKANRWLWHRYWNYWRYVCSNRWKRALDLNSLVFVNSIFYVTTTLLPFWVLFPAKWERRINTSNTCTSYHDSSSIVVSNKKEWSFTKAKLSKDVTSLTQLDATIRSLGLAVHCEIE